MSHDHTKNLFFEAIESYCKEQRSKGLTEDEIIDSLDDEKIKTSYISMVKRMTEDSVSMLQNSMYERVLQERGNNAQFIIHNEQIWQRGFVASEMMYLIVIEAAEDYREIFDNLPNEQKNALQYKYSAILQLHARACQQYLEILCLLKSGFADGAFARWRSMYELCVVAHFISKNGEPVAKAYCNELYNVNSKDYHWAKEAPGFSKKNRVTFRDIMNDCKSITERWESVYGFSNKVVHATPQGTYRRLGTPPSTAIVPVGPSDYGLAMPAVNAAIILSIISSLFFTMLHSGDGSWYSMVTSSWVDHIKRIYTEIEENSFPSITSDDSLAPKETE